MMKMKFTKIALSIVAMSLAVSAFCEELAPAEKRMRSINAAKQIAERNVVETVLGIQLEYVSTISNLDAASFSSSSLAISKGKVRGIRLATQYDAEKDIAIATAELEVAKIEDLAPAWKDAKSTVIRRVGFSSTTPKSLKKIQAIRAAELDAYRGLFQQVQGFELESKTTVKDLMLKDDSITSRCAGIIFAAKMITDPNDKDTITWTGAGDDDGCTVTLELLVKDIEAVLGQKIVGNEADVIRVKGVGLPYKQPVAKQKAPAAVEAPAPKVIEKKVYVEKAVPVIIERESHTQDVRSKVTP